MFSQPPAFVCIPLGAEGGLREGDLSSYLLAVRGSTDFICLDAGTLMDGLAVARTKGCFDNITVSADAALTVEGTVLHRHVKAYLITHPYLDHVEGLVQSSPTDTDKPLFGLPGVLDDLEKHLFNWRLWPNFCDRGVAPCLNRYRYQPLLPGVVTAIAGTPLKVETHPLAHGPQTDSGAFLLEAAGHYCLYMGDTGPDSVEGRPTTQRLWERIAPLIRQGLLHGIFIETSYDNSRPDELLFSHLTPAWLLHAFRQLATLVDPTAPATALAGLNVIITHIKPDFAAGPPPAARIQAELTAGNDLGLHFRFAEQGVRFEI